MHTRSHYLRKWYGDVIAVTPAPLPATLPLFATGSEFMALVLKPREISDGMGIAAESLVAMQNRGSPGCGRRLLVVVARRMIRLSMRHA